MIKNLSIIYPIFNEEKRLFNIFQDIKKFNKKTHHINKEYIFVNDGSFDNSKKKIKDFIKLNKNSKIQYKIISYKVNKGKGYALKSGVLNSTKKWILTTDSDCSVSNFQILRWMKKNYINEENMIYFASRNHPISLVKKIKSREIIGAIFRFAISLIFNVKISDTQCGFKLYRANIAKKIFSKIKTNGYMHDLEICIISKKMKLTINELPVIWKHKFEGKISFLKDSIKIILSLIMIKFYRY